MLQKLILNLKKIMIDSSLINHNGKSLNKILYPIGSIYCTSENENPETTLGGKWELVDKEFAPKTIIYTNETDDKPEFTINKTTTSQFSIVIVREGHRLIFRFIFKTKVAISPGYITFATIHFDKIGLNTNNGGYGQYVVMQSSDGHGIATGLFNTTGEIMSSDCVTKTSGGNIPANSTINISYDWHVQFDRMADDECNKFYWKRIS